MSDRAPYATGVQNPVRIRRPKIGDLARQAQGVRILAKGEIPGAREEQAPPLPLTLRPFYATIKPTTRKVRWNMKNVSTKIPAMIAMLIAIFSLGLLIAAFIVSINEVEPESGVSKSFAFWVFAVITSMLSLIFYFIDAVFSTIKAFMKIHPIFNIVLALLLIGATPMMLFVGGKLGINIYIYFSYYLSIFVLEIISIIKHIKLSQIDKNTDLEQTIELQ